MNDLLQSAFNPQNRSFPEANKWELSKFVLNNLVKIVGFHPFPLDELLFMCSSVVYFQPDVIIEWGTHLGVSARIFYEIVRSSGLKTEIHSIDLPPEAEHVENVTVLEQRGKFVKGLPVSLHLGDGLDKAKELLRNKKYNFPLFFVDGDHSFNSVWRELNGIKELTDNAAILVHDTFYQGKESHYNCGPFEAVKKFTEENNLFFWSTNIGLPGMSLIWLGGPNLSIVGQKIILKHQQEESETPVNKKIIEKLHKHSENLSLSILHTVEFYHPHIGGAETVVQQISERLAKRGHHVEVATTKLPDRDFQELNGVAINEFDVAGNLACGVRGNDIQRYIDFLLGHSADVMMNYAAQQWATDLAFFALEATQNKRVNVIAPCGYSALEDARTLRWPQFADYFGKIIPVVIPYYDAAIYHSSMYKDYEFAQLHGFQNSVVIPNGVDEEEFTKIPTINFREKYKIKTPHLGLCVANFYKDKGHDRIIEAVRQMNHKDFTMVFIGKDGDELQALKKQSSNLNIKFLVNIPREDTVAAFHAADIFLFGSSIEASPLVIIEAKASKTPFVSTDCGNVREWKGGIVCSPEEMAENANKLLNDESLRKQLAEEGYREWKEKLTWEAVVDKYEELYTRLHHSKRKQVTVPQPMTEYDEKQFSERLQKNFKDVPTLVRLAEIELQRSNQKKAKNYLIAALAIEPQNVAAKTLLEKLQ